MDVGELLKFKPQTLVVKESEPVKSGRSKRDGEAAEKAAAAERQRAKRRRLAHLDQPAAPSAPGPSATPHSSAGRYHPGQRSSSSDNSRHHQQHHQQQIVLRDDEDEVQEFTDEDRMRLLEMVEKQGVDESAEPLDEGSLKRMLLLFEKRALKNQEMRIKFPDHPEKFMESELELNEVIQEMHVIATVPDLYNILVDLKSVSSMLSLLSHENTDIAVAVIDLIQELTDVDTLNEGDEGAHALVGALLDDQICGLLVQNMERFNESVREEADGVHNALAIIENLTEFRVDVGVLATQQGLMAYVLKRLRPKLPFDANKLYCSEVLAILLQGNQDNKQTICDIDGIDSLLQILAFYKRHDPGSEEEREMMENLFNCLCAALSHPPSRDKFLKGEGLQLMNLMLREKRASRTGALKVLDHALTGVEGKDNCNKFVDILGLRTIFPLFMKTPSKHKRKGVGVEEHEEHVVSIIANMLKHCKGSQMQRLLSKFVENDHEKVDRLMELHFKYLDKVQRTDATLEQEMEEEGNEDEMYIRRLEGGLFTLQMVDFVILEACASAAASVKQRVMQSLNLRGASVKTIRNIMREYVGNLGDTDQTWKEQEQKHILALVDKF